MKKYLIQLKNYAQLMRLHRPIGILLLLWPALWALWVAGDGHPRVYLVIIFILGGIIMRSAGCVINDIADRNIDGFVTRTKDRPLASGKITLKAALILFGVLVLIAFGLVLLLNRLTILLSIAALLLAVIYPFMKRISNSPQLVLGLAFAWAIPMAFAAQTNTVPAIAWLIFLIDIFWVIIYDTMYAMVDKKDDLVIGVKSTAILFGAADRVIIAMLQTILIALFFLMGILLKLNFFYYLAVMVALGFAMYQQYLIKERDPAKCFRAFLNNRWLGLVIFVGLVLSYF